MMGAASVFTGLAACIAASLVMAAPAHAERLTVSLSTHRILIASNFSGVDLTLFGAVDVDAAAVGRAGTYAVVTTVTGPRESVITWRKERLLGIWINQQRRRFVEVPRYLAVLANRPIATIAAPDRLRRFQIGLRHFLLPQQIGTDVIDTAPDDPFRQAFLRVKGESGLYVEQPNAITFLNTTLFRTVIPLPANVPVGDYAVDTKLFVDGVMIANESTAFEIIKTGLEQFVATSARQNAILYGFATTALALLTGWLGSVVFRRD